MTEQVLLDYFLNKASVEELSEDLKGSQKRTSHKATSVYISPLDDGHEFEIKKEHVLRLCNECLDRKLSLEDLNTIAFALMTSDFFALDENDAILDRVLFEWDNPEIGFPLTLENMKKWKLLLENGDDQFDIKELNQNKNGG